MKISPNPALSKDEKLQFLRLIDTISNDTFLKPLRELQNRPLDAYERYYTGNRADD